MIAPADFERVPPHDSDAEMALLGCILIDDAAFAKCRVSAQDFYRTDHRRVYESCQRIHAAGRQIDAVAVADEMRVHGADPVDLAPLIQMDHAANASEYARIVREKASGRAVIRLASEMQRAGYDGEIQNGAVEGFGVRLAQIAYEFAPHDSEEDMPTLTTDALRSEPDDEAEFLWPGAVVRGDLTLLTGNPKAGKSFLLYAWLAALERGESWFGRAAAGNPGALVITEEGHKSIRRKIDAFGLATTVFVTRRRTKRNISWADVVRRNAERAVKLGCAVLIVDTFAAWAGFGEGQENDAALMTEKLQPLIDAAALGLAVVLVHHSRKQDGAVGTGVRGSSALLANVGCLVEIRHFAGEDDPRRSVSILGRHENPVGATVVRYVKGKAGQPDGYELLGNAADARDKGKDVEILRVLGDSGKWLTAEEIADLTGMKVRTVQNRLPRMYQQRLVQRVGPGTKAEAFLYAALGTALTGSGKAAP